MAVKKSDSSAQWFRPLQAAAVASVVAQAAISYPLAAQPSITMQGQAENAAKAPIRDSLGRTCLDVEAAARLQIINRQMVDHVVSIKNNCAKLIKLEICYFDTPNCRAVELQPYRRVDTILGSALGQNFFRYTIKPKQTPGLF